MIDISKRTVQNDAVKVVAWKVDRSHDAIIPTEVISIRDRLYEVQGTGKPEDYETFFAGAEGRNEDFVVVPNFTSEKHTKPTFAVLVPANKNTAMAMQMYAEGNPLSGIFSEYMNAVRSAAGLVLEEKRK